MNRLWLVLLMLVPHFASAGEPMRLIDDDGATLWEAPPSGEPLDLTLLPSGTQVVVYLRPAALAQSRHRAGLVAAGGPRGAALLAQFAARGLEASQVESLTIAWTVDDAGALQKCCKVRFVSNAEWAQIFKSCGGPASGAKQGAVEWEWNQSAYWVPDLAERNLVIAKRSLLKEIQEEPAPALRRQLAALREVSDAQSDVVVLFAPEFLLEGDGKSLLETDDEPVRRALLAWQGPEPLLAQMISVRIEPQCYLEVRGIGPLDRDPRRLAAQWKSRLQRFPSECESYLASVKGQGMPGTFAKRFPAMLQLLVKSSRVGNEGRQVVLRSYLPAGAAPSGLLAIGLVSAVGVQDGEQTGVAAGGRTAEQALAQPVSLVFSKDTLEHSVELLSQEIQVPISIQGKDLQREGITKNQSFELQLRNVPAGEVLRAILKKSSPEGKLVYIVRQEGDRQVLWISTRQAAAQNDWTLADDQRDSPTRGK